VSGADRAIRVSTAIAVLGVAGIAAYVSYWHAYEVVRAHGENGVTARLEPATIDGLVYSSSMVVLYATRHRLPAPGLARWLLALGIVATLAANMAHGWSSGPVGAAVAAWPAASLVGSYELLLWLIRTSAVGAVAREPAPDHGHGLTAHPFTDLRLMPLGARGGGGHENGQGRHTLANSSLAGTVDQAGGPARTSVPEPAEAGQEHSAPGQLMSVALAPAQTLAGTEGIDVNAAAVAAYRESISNGQPLSERKLASMFGKTSRRWARHRMAEARQAPASAMAGTQ
jgi:Protein of unknown function (DUF2637)